MRTADFDYHLPEELIAQTPLKNRSASRMLVLDKEKGQVTHRNFPDILEYLGPNDLLVLNATRVIPARLYGHKKDTGGAVEVFLVHPGKEQDTWECLVRPGRKIREGTEILFQEGILEGQVLERTQGGGRLLRFTYQGEFMKALEKAGEVPLPPYIREKLEDAERYQTVYAREEGSVAAPTAGLHFTPEILEDLQKKGVEIARVTLHVGVGTFRPVSVEDIREHTMHGEYFSIDDENKKIIEEGLQNGKRIVAVGTTSTRTLESSVQNGKIVRQQGWTDIFIYPGYQFQATHALLTNFHLPKSTLLMLVSAMAGKENVLRAYQEAVEHQYRFFSFGDCMFIC